MSQHQDDREDDRGDEGGLGSASPPSICTGAIILAGSSPLLWAPLLGRPLVAWTVEVFERVPNISAVVLIVAPKRVAEARALAAVAGWDKAGVLAAPGALPGALRAGLEALEARCRSLALVVVHEGTRPLVTPELIAAGIMAARGTGVAVAAEPVKETIKRVRGGLIVGTVPRERLVRAQTPAVFTPMLLRSALHAIPPGAPLLEDMLGCAIASGLPVALFPSSPENVRVAAPDELALVEALLQRR